MTPFERGLLVPDGNTCALLDRKLRLPYHQPFCNTTSSDAYPSMDRHLGGPRQWRLPR
jgi:hypothetical protein